MEWSPVNRERLDQILKDELKSLGQALLATYQEYATNPVELPCFRGGSYGIEHMFVIARKDTRVLFFDDVEEDFGVGTPAEDGVLRDWGTFSAKERELNALESET